MSRLSDKFPYYPIRGGDGILRGYFKSPVSTYESTGSYFFLNDRSKGILAPQNATITLKER